jgi:hypothetical protein
VSEYHELHHGAESEAARQLVAAANRRLDARDLDDYKIAETDVVSSAVLLAVRKAAWGLGALKSTLDQMEKTGTIPVGVQRIIRHPGTRNAEQKDRGVKRVAAMRKARKEREAHKTKRSEVKRLAIQAAANYRKNPSAYHYYAGGTANLIFLEPSPPSYRSDCSQFIASIWKAAGLPSPASVPHQWASTHTMTSCPAARLVTRSELRPGCVGMYGESSGPLVTRSTHHTEAFVGDPDARWIGHGSPPIDSLTPGEPDFYMDYPSYF